MLALLRLAHGGRRRRSGRWQGPPLHEESILAATSGSQLRRQRERVAPAALLSRNG